MNTIYWDLTRVFFLRAWHDVHVHCLFLQLGDDAVQLLCRLLTEDEELIVARVTLGRAGLYLGQVDIVFLPNKNLINWISKFWKGTSKNTIPYSPFYVAVSCSFVLSTTDWKTHIKQNSSENMQIKYINCSIFFYFCLF